MSVWGMVALLVLLAGLLRPAPATAGRLHLVPLPANYTTGDTVVCLSPDFEVTFAHAPPDLERAAGRMLARLRESRHTYLSPTRGGEFFVKGGCELFVDALDVEVASPGSVFGHATRRVETRSEGYRLDVRAGRARAAADTALGAFRALTTFENLWYTAALGPGTSGQVPLARPAEVTYAPFAPYAIADAPAFPWRAVLLDTSRHFFPPPSLRAMLDAMAAAKLNVFHWHITDSNSWPLDLAALPELAGGAYSPSQIYNEDDVRELVAYAGERGIDVVMEIDTPGHTAIIGESHPDYIACRDAPWMGYANQPPAGQLRFADDAVVNYTTAIFGAAAELTASAYFGTGGDELNLRCMREDGPTQATLKAQGWTLEAALKRFTNRTHSTLLEKGHTPVVWQEMVLDHGDLELHPDTIVDVWLSSGDARRVLDKGYRIVHAASDYFYLVSTAQKPG
jgi:hexosaminidase